MFLIIILSFMILQNSWLWEFKKNPNNPVIPYGASGEWDRHDVLDGHLLKDEDTFKLYYVGRNGHYEDSFPSKGIGYSYSYDRGKTWTKYSGNPVFISDSSGWERTNDATGGLDGLWEAAMKKDNGLYKMWYQAKDSTNRQNSLYATSNDGIHWVRRNNHMPVVRAGSFDWSWDGWWAGARNVIEVRDSFYLFYEGIALGGIPSAPIHLGLAVGPDETTFVKVDTLPVFAPKGTEDTVWCGDGMIPSVIFINSTFVLFYSGGKENEQPAKIGVGIAFSKDGRKWRRYRRNPVYDGETGQPGEWDSASFTFINAENMGSESKPLLMGTYRARTPGWRFEIGVVTIDAKDLVPPSTPVTISPQNGAISSTPITKFCYTKAEDNFTGSPGSGVEYYILKYGNSIIETEDTVYTTLLEDGQYNWKVQAIDSAGWESEWAEGTFIIDTKPPKITNTTRWDSTEFSGPFIVYSEITDENAGSPGSGVEKAELYYKCRGGSRTAPTDTGWTSVLMEKSGGQYSGEIPSQSETTTISYYVYAEDKADTSNKATDPPDAPDSCYSFTICKISEGDRDNGAFVSVTPNPFMRATTIKYSLPFESRVHIKVYAISGNMVKGIYEDVCPGCHFVELETKDLSSGVYFMEFYAIPKYAPDKKYKVIRKLILIR